MRSSIVVIWVIAALAGPAVVPVCRAQVAVPDTTAPSVVPPDSIRTIVITDSLGVPGTLKGQSDYDPVRMKEILQRMGASEVTGRTAWERRKNPRTAMLCSMLLPGLGQTYNGRRLKVGLMVGAASFYMGNSWLNWRRHEAASLRRESATPGSGEYRLQGQLSEFYKEEARTYLWWSGAAWLIGLVDSWIDAHLYDVREYTPPRPPDESVPRIESETSYLTVGIGLSLK